MVKLNHRDVAEATIEAAYNEELFVEAYNDEAEDAQSFTDCQSVEALLRNKSLSWQLTLQEIEEGHRYDSVGAELTVVHDYDLAGLLAFSIVAADLGCGDQ